MDESEELKQLRWEKQFIANWLSDLLGAADETLDEPSRVKLFEGCGRGCFLRHSFKQEIAEQGKGSLDKLLEAYSHNFEVWREGEQVHIRYGEVSSGCYCPVAKTQPVKEHDLHCECTRMTHQTIFETALGHPVRSEIVESLRRGGKTCHFLVSVGG